MASPDDSGAIVRVRVVYRGRVQGVGFRYTTLEISRDHAVTGYVRNMPDGNVELEAQGTPDAVASFLSAIQHTMRGNIREAAKCDAPVLANEREFEVRY